MLMPIAMFFLFVSGIIWGAILGTIISTIATSAAASISFLIMRNFSKNNFFSKLKQKISDKIDLNIDKKRSNKIYYLVYLKSIFASESFKLCIWSYKRQVQRFFYINYARIVNFELFLCYVRLRVLR